MRLEIKRMAAVPPEGSLPEQSAAPKKTGLRRFFSILGPGLVTGAADDDPSGIVTYSIAGAQLGTRMLWVALLSWPLMCAVQMMCARIGMVTGGGLATALRKKFPKPVLVVAGLGLFIANTINIGADLFGMADVSHLLTGIPNEIWVIVFGAGIIFATVKFRYSAIANILKWLAVFLFAYVITAFLVHPDWHKVLRDTFLPSAIRSHDEWATLVAILGTTISPYLFFWQASQEIEEQKAKGHRTLASRKGATEAEIRERKLDVGIGGFFSNLIMFFIILTTALTLHAHGITKIETSKDAVLALKPLAGQFAALLYATGLIGVGFLAIPTPGRVGGLRLHGNLRLPPRLGRNPATGARLLWHSHSFRRPRHRDDLPAHQTGRRPFLDRGDQRRTRPVPSGGDSYGRLRPGDHAESAQLDAGPDRGWYHRRGNVRRGHRPFYPLMNLPTPCSKLLSALHDLFSG